MYDEITLDTETKIETPITPPVEEADTKSEETWDRIIRGIVYALAFVLPLLFTPWTFESLEFSKQMLLMVLVSIGVVIWLLKLLVLRTWRLVKTPLDLPIGIFLLVYLLASIFSIDKIASFLGFYGSFSGNFFQVLFLVLLYYLIVNNFHTVRDVKRLIGIFVFSALIALMYNALQFFGWYVIPVSIAKTQSFNTIGGLLMLSLFSAVAVVLALGNQKSGSWFGIFSGRVWGIAVFVLGFLVLLTVNFIYAWLGLLLGVLLYLIFQVAMAKDFSMKRLVTPLILLVIIVSFLVIQLIFPFVNVRSIFSFNLPVEVRLDYKTAGPVIKGTVTERPILGSGPNTFQYAFSRHRSEAFNLSPFWNIRFDKAPSEASEYLVGTGIVGFLAFEILSVIFLVYALFFLFKKREAEGWDMALALFSVFALLWFAHWIFFFNTVMVFAYWLTIAAFMALSRIVGEERVKTFSFSLATSPRQTVSVVSLVSLGLVVMIVFLVFASSVYASDIFYKRGVTLGNRVESYDQAQRDLERAVRLNRFRPDYYLTYGEFLILRINQELANPNPNLGQIQTWIASSINTAHSAVDLSPNNWTAWERLANLYAFARPLVAGVDKFIIESLTRATETDAKNPILFTELGQVYRLAARQLDPAILGKGTDSDFDGLSDEQEKVLGSDPADPDTNGNSVLDGNEVVSGLNPASSGNLPDAFINQYIRNDAESLLKSEEAFRKAITLKDDYAAAYYQLALTLEQEGKFDEAITVLEQALQKLPANVVIKFELGRLYYNTGKIERAMLQFREIIALVPNHSNSHFSLALSYERQGNVKKALDEYRRVLELNPGNSQIEGKIQELETILSGQPQ